MVRLRRIWFSILRVVQRRIALASPDDSPPMISPFGCVARRLNPRLDNLRFATDSTGQVPRHDTYQVVIGACRRGDLIPQRGDALLRKHPPTLQLDAESNGLLTIGRAINKFHIRESLAGALETVCRPLRVGIPDSSQLVQGADNLKFNSSPHERVEAEQVGSGDPTYGVLKVELAR